MGFSNVERCRFGRRAVRGFAPPPGRNRAAVVDRSRRILGRAEAAISIWRAAGAANVGVRSSRSAAVRRRDFDRARGRPTTRARSGEEANYAAAGSGPSKNRSRGRYCCRNRDPDREARKDLAEDNRVAGKDRVGDNDRAKKRRKDREGEDLSAATDRVDNRRVGSRPYDRRKAACSRRACNRRAWSRAGSDRRVLDPRRCRLLFLPFRDPRRRGLRRRARLETRRARGQGCATFPPRCRVR